MGVVLPIGLATALFMATPSADLDDGIALYQNKDYRGALAAFGRANAAKQSPKQRATIHLYIGIIQYRFGRTDDARSSFEEGLSHTTQIAFPDASQSGAERLFEEVRAETVADPTPEKKKRRKRRRRKKRSPEEPPDEPRTKGAIARTETTAVPTYFPPPAPPPLVKTIDPDDGPPASAWVLAGVGTAAVVAGVVFVAVGVGNGNAAQDLGRDAVSSNELYGTYQKQLGIGIGSLAIGAIAGALATYLFVAE